MAFYLIGPRSDVAIEARDERIFWEIPSRYSLTTPQCDFIWDAFYRSPSLSSPEQVAALRDEIQTIRTAYEADRRRILQKERKVHSKDPAVVDRILGTLLSDDPVLRKCDELLALCDEASSAGEGLSSSSD